MIKQYLIGVEIPFSRFKTSFFIIFACPSKKIEDSAQLLQVAVNIWVVLTGCIKKNIIKVNIRGFKMGYFILFFIFFGNNKSVPGFMSLP